MPRNYLVYGEWNAICDQCGFKFKASQLRKRWDGLMTCVKCWEPRHPQDFLRVRGDKPSVPWTRPEGEIFINPVCYIWDIHAYTGLATCGCAQTGKTFPFTSVQLYALKFPPMPA